MKMIFHYDTNKSHFHNKGFALSLVLKVRFFGTRKWPIPQAKMSPIPESRFPFTTRKDDFPAVPDFYGHRHDSNMCWNIYLYNANYRKYVRCINDHSLSSFNCYYKEFLVLLNFKPKMATIKVPVNCRSTPYCDNKKSN